MRMRDFTQLRLHQRAVSRTSTPTPTTDGHGAAFATLTVASHPRRAAPRRGCRQGAGSRVGGGPTGAFDATSHGDRHDLARHCRTDPTFAPGCARCAHAGVCGCCLRWPLAPRGAGGRSAGPRRPPRRAAPARSGCYSADAGEWVAAAAQPAAHHRRPPRHRRAARAPSCSVGSTTLRLDGGSELEVRGSTTSADRAAAAQRQRRRAAARRARRAREFELRHRRRPLPRRSAPAATASTASTDAATLTVWSGQAALRRRRQRADRRRRPARRVLDRRRTARTQYTMTEPDARRVRRLGRRARPRATTRSRRRRATSRPR